MVKVTGTTAFGVSETEVVLKVPVDATLQLDEPPDHVQLDGKSCTLRATVPVNVLPAATLKL
jgi:hypothetical protein